MAKPDAEDKTFFVTVGTTLFEKLVQASTSEGALNWMQRNGYTKLIVQYGKGQKPTLPESFVSSNNNNKFSVEVYDFKPSLAQDMAQADLVLSHAGAGTISEVLGLENPRLVVVVNTLLMDNHQLELAHAMERRGYLYVVESPDILMTSTTATTNQDNHNRDNNNSHNNFNKVCWDDFEMFEPRPPDPTDPMSFGKILDSFFGWGE